MSEPYNPPTAPPPTGPPTMHGGGPGLPWDREKSGNTLVETAKRLITAPGAAYAEMREKGDYASPIFFALIFGTFGGIVNQIWSLVFGAAYLQFLPPELQEQIPAMAAGGVGSAIFGIVLAPVFALIGLFIGAAIYHLFLLLVGGTKESTAGFEGTVRAVGYGAVVNVALIVPIVGGLVAGIWGLVLYVIGLSRVHHTTTGKAVAAVLLPIVVCCLCVILALFFFGGLGAMMGAMGADQ